MTIYETPVYPEEQEPQVPVVGVGRRFAAYMIDWIVLSVGGFFLGVAIALPLFIVGGFGEEMELLVNLVTSCLGFVLNALYFVIFWAATGQSPGKMVVGIKIVRTDGSRVSWTQSILRYIGYIVSALALSLGYAWIAFDSRRQGWHDKMADTVVVPTGALFPSSPLVEFVPDESVDSRLLVFIYYGFSCFLIFSLVACVVLLLLSLAGSPDSPFGGAF
jgi:uncharacterized RDD family membrane protein YckC